MQPDIHRPVSTKLVTFTLAAFAAASAVYWGLKGWGPPAASTVAVVALAPNPAPPAQALALALGGGVAPTPALSGATAAGADSHYALVGVLAGRHRAGSALISVQGQDARPVRVGQPVDDAVMLQSVSSRRAVLVSLRGDAQKFTLELPAQEE